MSVLVILGRRTEMYAGRVACCCLVSHTEYTPRALFLVINKIAPYRTDGRLFTTDVSVKFKVT